MEFQFYKMKRLMERDGGDGCTTLRIDLIPLNGTLQMIKGGKCYVYFTTIKSCGGWGEEGSNVICTWRGKMNTKIKKNGKTDYKCFFCLLTFL